MATRMSTGAAAKYLGIGPQTLRDWAGAGRVPYEKTPTGRMLYAQADLDQLLQRVEDGRNEQAAIAAAEHRPGDDK